MKTPGPLSKIIAIKLVAAAILLPTAKASHDCDPLVHDAKQLKEKAYDLRKDYVHFLRAHNRWKPCGAEERFYLAVVDFERSTANVVAALKRNRFHDACHFLRGARSAANRMHHASRYVRLSRSVGEDLVKSERRLCRVESAFGGHRASRIPHRSRHHAAHSGRAAAIRPEVPRDLGNLLRLIASR